MRFVLESLSIMAFERGSSTIRSRLLGVQPCSAIHEPANSAV